MRRLELILDRSEAGSVPVSSNDPVNPSGISQEAGGKEDLHSLVLGSRTGHSSLEHLRVSHNALPIHLGSSNDEEKSVTHVARELRVDPSPVS